MATKAKTSCTTILHNEGKIDNIDTDTNRLTVLIDLFGQETPVEVELYQVSK